METAPLLPRLSDYVAWRAQRSPDAEALVLDEDRWSYAILAQRIDRLAKALLAAGVAKGDRVATLQTPRPEYLEAFLATASIGAIWVGLNPKYRLGELEHVVQDSTPMILLARTRIGNRSYDDELKVLGQAARLVRFDGEPEAAGAESMESFLRGGESISDDALALARQKAGGGDPCMIVYTSGSTGRPKGALLGHEAIARFCLAQNALWPTRPQRALNYFPINHIGCVVDITMPAIVDGGAIVFMEQFDPALAMEKTVAESLTIWGSVPSVLQMQLSLPDFDRYDLSAVQLILWEGAAAPEDMIRRLVAIRPRLATNYGMTEALGITVVEPTDDLEILAHSVGQAFSEVEIRLTGETGVEVKDGEVGEIEVRSPFLFSGYWNRPEATAESMTADGFFRTGDLGVRRPDGRYRIVGRAKEMYKSGGYNVYPREVEAVLEAHPDVDIAAVVSRPDPLWQEVGVAFVTTVGPVTVEALKAWCAERLANYKAPKAIVIEQNLPLLPIGKVDKQALKLRAAQEA